MENLQAGPEVFSAPVLLWFEASGFKPHSFGVCMVSFPYQAIQSRPARQSTGAWGPHVGAVWFSFLLSHVQTSQTPRLAAFVSKCFPLERVKVGAQWRV